MNTRATLYTLRALIAVILCLTATNAPAQNNGTATGSTNGHQWVDLGLPSGTKWATCNIGASSPGEKGNYFAWGEPNSKNIFTTENSTTCNKQIPGFSGKAEYDAATASWGPEWRMPTKEELEELLYNCHWELANTDGQKGYRVTSKKNGNSIFLPASGCSADGCDEFTGYIGYYWSSTPESDLNILNYETSYYLYFTYGDPGGESPFRLRKAQRPLGLTIRAVTGTVSAAARPITGKENGHQWVDLGLPSGTRWATCNVGASSPEQAGKYYAWGETKPKSTYTLENSATWRKKVEQMGGNSIYDAATANWGGNWRTPTKEEWEELEMCNWKWTTEGGRKGWKVTSTVNGNSIFIPSNGQRNEAGKLESLNTNGAYWTSSPKGILNAYNYIFSAIEGYTGESGRGCGYGVRPVLNKEEIVLDIPFSGEINGHKWVDLGLPSGTKWATCNVDSKLSQEPGKMYLWGEVTAHDKPSSYKRNTYKKDVGSSISGNETYDVARAKWGGSWRLPSKKELEELIDNCNWEWTNMGGINGFKVSSTTNGNWIFLPEGNEGKYWSGNAANNWVQDDSAAIISFFQGSATPSILSRNHPACIRPVSD
ncbi:MAG: hypothetical protein J6U83_04185 [Bacteroidales bacterium]|nr:hypothetical protein [Bacteroidales bacterium]